MVEKKKNTKKKVSKKVEKTSAKVSNKAGKTSAKASKKAGKNPAKKSTALSKKQNEASHLTSDKSKSFNEVSFDVLENAVEKSNSLFGYKSKDFKGRTIIASDEMLPKKKILGIFPRRKRDKANLGKLAVMTLILILFFGVLSMCVVYLSNNDIFNKPTHNSELKLAIGEIANYDSEIIKLNKFLENPINESTINNIDFDEEDLEDLKNDLNDLSDKISEVGQTIDPQSDDYVYVGYAKQTIESRIMMIDAGIKILKEAKDSVNVISKTEQFWDNVIKADAYLKESDNLIQSNDSSNYELAKSNSETAANLLNEAKVQIAELTNITKAFDFSIYNRYIDARLESAIYSSAACQALMDENLTDIGTLNTAYIEKSNKASDIALAMSTSPVQVLRTNYDIKIRPLVDEFKAARKNAAENDYAIRSFINSF